MQNTAVEIFNCTKSHCHSNTRVTFISFLTLVSIGIKSTFMTSNYDIADAVNLTDKQKILQMLK